MVHNVIHIFDPQDTVVFSEDDIAHEEQQNGHNYLSGHSNAVEREQGAQMRDSIAREMWSSYQETIRKH